MAVKLEVLFLIFWNVCLCYSVFHENTLNVPQLLLPYVSKDSKPTTFELKALKGCFKWTSTNPNVATIAPLNEKLNSRISLDEDDAQCSQSALVIVTSKTPDEDATVILAEEEGTGLILRCDVFVDSIHHIDVATTTRELLLGESPEVFDIYAYDKEGNLFSSLRSEVFEWGLAPVPNNDKIDPKSVLRFLWFIDSSYETTDAIYKLEDSHIRGSSALVEGVRTGEAIVSAKLADPEYKHVASTSVKLTVIDNVMLIPTTSYLMVSQVIRFSARQLRRGKINDISLPSEQYTIKVVDTNIGRMNPSDASVFTLALGVTKVQLIDKNMAVLSSMRLPTATIHVVEPAKIGFVVFPGKNWILQTLRIYEIHVRLYDVENNRIEITDNTILDSILSKEYFDVYRKTVNGSYYHVQAKKTGMTMLTAKLDSISYPPNETYGLKSLYGEQKIEIHGAITLTPEFVYFPWDPSHATTQSYHYKLAAAGGGGNYAWSSNNSSFATVNKKGVVIAGSVIGLTKIRAADLKNLRHFAESTVKVLPPEEIHFTPSTVEVEVASQLILPVTVSAFLNGDRKEQIFFKDCRQLHLDLSFSDATVFKIIESDVEIDPPTAGCRSVVVEGLKLGHTMLTATYKYADVVLQASIVIAAYNPLKIIDPSDFATVTIGSTKRVIAEGGPLPWVLDTTQFYELMSAEEEDWVSVGQVLKTKENSLHQHWHFFDVLCTQHGEQMLTVEVGNKPSAKNLQPAYSTATCRYLCSPPATLKLMPVISLPMIDGNRRLVESCKDNLKRIPVRNMRELRLNLMIYDANGNSFDNASSLQIDWSTDNMEAASFQSKELFYEYREHIPNLKQNGGNQVYQMLHISSHNVPLTVTAAISAYNAGSSEHIVNSIISTNLDLLLVSQPTIAPDSVSLFSDPTNQFNLDVKNGTNDFLLKSSDANLADIDFLPPRKIMITPKEEAKLTVYLYDLCLDSKSPSQAEITLTDVYSLQLTVSDKVELGQVIDAKCEALDFNKRILHVSDSSLKLKLQLKMSSNILHARKVPASTEHHQAQVSFNLTGKSVGITSLTCQAIKLSGLEIASKAEEVQVFSAIKLEPKHILLIVGSTFQIHSSGGPQPHSTTSFTIQNHTVADVSHSGLITTQKIGKTVINGISKGVDSSTAKEIIYSQDHVFLEVIQLKGFKISLKSRNIANNAEIRILCIGITNEGPFTFASSQPYLQFHWSSSNHNVAVVESLHYKAGVSVTSDKDFRVVLRTLSPGQVTIKLKVEVLSNDHIEVIRNTELEDEIQVQVFEELRMLHPQDGKLLLPHNTHSRLRTNRDQQSRITYEMLSSCPDATKTPPISISSTGVVSSHSFSGIININVIVHEDFGFNQSVLVQVEVKPVAVISLVAISQFVLVEEGRPSFPIGSNALFGLTLHDNVGRKFDALLIQLKHRTSRSDVVHVIQNSENGTYSIRGTSVGETILKVWSKDNPTIVDYIRLRITQAISPSAISIVLGDAICLQSAITTDVGWWSASSNTVSVDRKSGVLMGVSLGSTIIHYNEQTFNTYTEVTVTSPIGPPRVIDDENLLYVSNAHEKKYFPVSFRGSANSNVKCPKRETNEKSGVSIPFLCVTKWTDAQGEISIQDIFSVQPVYIGRKPACSFTLRQLSTLHQKIVSKTDRTLSLSVVLHDKALHHELSSSPVDIRFIPDLYVDSTIVHLSSEQTSHVVEIFGSYSQLSGLKITSDSSILSITQLETEEASKHQYKLILRKMPTAHINISVKVFSPITKKASVISVRVIGNLASSLQCHHHVNGITNKAWWFNLLGGNATWVVAYTIIIATILLILILYHSYTNRQSANRQTQQPVMLSPAYVMQHSPPPYQYTPSYNLNKDIGSPYGSVKQTTPQRALFSVSQ